MTQVFENGIFLAIVAHGLLGISLIWDKVLLKNPGTKDLFSYVFWLGGMSIFGLLLLPFGYHSPPLSVILIAFVAGVVHLAGVFFYYAALKRGEASETLAVMGGFSPIATAAIGFALLSTQPGGRQLLGFALLTAGGFVMFFSERLPLKRLWLPVLLAAGLLGLVNVLGKVVYDQVNFVSGYVWFTIGTFIGAMALLIPPSWRKQIFSESGQDNPRNRFWYFVNRFVSGVGSFLIFLAISRAHPALVDAISGVRYAVIFLGALLLTKLKPAWLRERFEGLELATKAIATCFVIAGLVLVGESSATNSNSGTHSAGFSKPEIVVHSEHAQSASSFSLFPFAGKYVSGAPGSAAFRFGDPGRGLFSACLRRPENTVVRPLRFSSRHSTAKLGSRSSQVIHHFMVEAFTVSRSVHLRNGRCSTIRAARTGPMPPILLS